MPLIASLVHKLCDEIIQTYFRVNKDRFSAISNNTKPVGVFSRIKCWIENASQNHHSIAVIDVERHAYVYFFRSLSNLFLKSGLDDAASKILVKGYVVDVKKCGEIVLSIEKKYRN